MLLLAASLNGLIYLLVALVILAVIFFIAKLILDAIPASPTVRTIAYLVLFIIALLVCLTYFKII